MTAEIAVSGSRQRVNNCATKETLKVLIKLLVGDTTHALNVSKAKEGSLTHKHAPITRPGRNLADVRGMKISRH